VSSKEGALPTSKGMRIQGTSKGMRIHGKSVLCIIVLLILLVHREFSHWATHRTSLPPIPSERQLDPKLKVDTDTEGRLRENVFIRTPEEVSNSDGDGDGDVDSDAASDLSRYFYNVTMGDNQNYPLRPLHKKELELCGSFGKLPSMADFQPRDGPENCIFEVRAGTRRHAQMHVQL
jgi:hypothetical protein